MADARREFLRVLVTRGWNVDLGETRGLLPAEERARYALLPLALEHFLSKIRVCRSKHDDAWIFGPDDYTLNRPGAVRWNECERMSLEAVAGDPVAEAEIRAFWDRHFPFMMAVSSDYDYLALRLDSDPSTHAVVHGHAPEFEQVTTVAPSFDALLSALAEAATATSPRYPFGIFLGST